MNCELGTKDTTRQLPQNVIQKLLLVLALFVIGGCKQPAADHANADLRSAEKPTGPAVALVIDYDDGLEKRYKLAWKEPMTALAALEAASNRQRGIRVQTKGSGDMAMVLSIDGLVNEGGGEGRNWIYRVNGNLADKSAGVYEVRPDDVILWKFGRYDE